MSQEQTKDMSQYFYRASAADFMKVPGAPVAYWPSEALRDCFSGHKSLSEIAKPRQGLATTDNERFLKLWFECSKDKIFIGSFAGSKPTESGATWYPCQKGGTFRKWYGNNEYVVNWKDNGLEIKTIVEARYGSASKRVVNEHLYFKEGITWSSLSSASLSMRYVPTGFIFETKGSMCFFQSNNTLFWALGFCNSCIVNPLLKCISPTLDYHEGPVGTLPISNKVNNRTIENSRKAINTTKLDWDSYETSWDFRGLPLLSTDIQPRTLRNRYRQLRAHWKQMTLEMQRLEEENNSLFMEAYGLQDELSFEVPLEEITLTCNPHYRYGGNRAKEELETLLQSDAMEELVSYAIGCMMGRYSLDKPGLILASQGETLQDYLRQIPTPRFAPDDDGILPLTAQEWFTDDATHRLREFIRVVWGDEALQENLDFVAESLCLHAIKPKKGEASLDTLRRYLSTQFFKDHLRTYKKRPIYWLFSSGKHKAFECLVYLHRYNEGTLARMRTEYVIPLTAKLSTYAAKLEKDLEASTSTAEKKRIEKELATLHNQQAELATFDEKLRHYADQRISLDLDDGVKVNYGKFGDLLAEVKAVTGGASE
ncbi:BREX-1 system adenine-specific DNA-methyltransferase PglX [Stutzerimonas balearica]|uniref:BREX-1 system adenine-specific DNA-methyltransferase PglX n=1 Tax=Stutzerimonas balearica TaxID=74829 RepID=UPI0022B0655A|nr:BREX-1 system adenine-specific DNA-methyltransferase PglX [Stutzerimonas balearica]MCZ4129877.1 BREX-1 system adenine-specific DNA-methyltransferase PglX [Stutzerimonas balearica]